MMLTLFMMGGATFLVGCLPTYEQVGLWAPALLVLCRVIQGISASGEQASANWLAVSLVVSGACLISVVAALTAKETKDKTLAGIDELHTTRTEAAELAKLDRTAP